MFKDDRKFFKTPVWKIIKKTEQQKVRYIETAMRLLDESRKASQQTLDNWRMNQDEDLSSDSDRNAVSSEGIVILGLSDHTSAPSGLQQTRIVDFNFTRTGVTTTESINGESSGLLTDGSAIASQS